MVPMKQVYASLTGLLLFAGPLLAQPRVNAASKVNVVGRVVNPEVLPKLRASRVRVTLSTEPRP